VSSQNKWSTRNKSTWIRKSLRVLKSTKRDNTDRAK